MKYLLYIYFLIIPIVIPDILFAGMQIDMDGDPVSLLGKNGDILIITLITGIIFGIFTITRLVSKIFRKNK